MPADLPDAYSLGSEDEALVCMEALGEAWVVHPDALYWLFAQLEQPEPPLRLF